MNMKPDTHNANIHSTLEGSWLALDTATDAMTIACSRMVSC